MHWRCFSVPILLSLAFNGECARRGRALEKEISGFHNQPIYNLRPCRCGWFGVVRAHIVTRLAARPYNGEAHKGATLQCTPYTMLFRL